MSLTKHNQLKTYNCLPRSLWKAGAITKRTPGAIQVQAFSHDEALLKACRQKPEWLLEKVLIHFAVEELPVSKAIAEAKEANKLRESKRIKTVIYLNVVTQKKAKCKVRLEGEEPFLVDGYELGKMFTCHKYYGSWQISLRESGYYVCSVDSLKEGKQFVTWCEDFLRVCEFPLVPTEIQVLEEIYCLKLRWSWLWLEYRFSS